MRFLLSGAVVLLACVSLPAATHAALRDPQVSVSGRALQVFFDSVGEHLMVGSDQDARQSYLPTVSSSGSFSALFELASATSAFSLGFYRAEDETPVLYPLFPPHSPGGWFAAASFRTAPARLVLSIFDENGLLQSSKTYPGEFRGPLGLYLQSPAGTLFTQDERNPDRNPQALFFAANVAEAGSYWVAWENLPLTGGGDADFDDAIVFIGKFSGTCLAECVPTRTATWGELKAFYR